MRPPSAGHVIVVCVLALLTLGVVMVTSAGMSIQTTGAGGAGGGGGTAAEVAPITLRTILLSRLTVYFALAMVTLAVAYHAAPSLLLRRSQGATPDPTSVEHPRPGWTLAPLWLGVLGLLLVVALVYVPGLGVERNGAHRWLSIRLPAGIDLSIQPSEIAKWGLVFLIAWYVVRAGPGTLGRFFAGVLPPLVAVGIVAAFLVLEDLGTAVLITMVSCLLLVAGGARVAHFAALAPIPVLGLVGAVAMHPYRLDRIRSFLDPYAEPDGAGYHMIQSMVAVANGQVSGRGLGHGLQKFGYLPEDTTDFIFAIICEELGVAGALVVCALYVGLAWAGLSIVRAQTAMLPKLIGLGIIATLGFQAMINLAVVTALGPTKGIALPLLSSGGTGWLMTAACLGLLAGLDRAGSRQVPESAAAPFAPPLATAP